MTDTPKKTIKKDPVSDNTTKSKQETKRVSNSKVSSSGRYVEGVGKRKTAIARVRITKQSGRKGKIIVNGKDFEQYFPLQEHQNTVVNPLVKTDLLGSFSVSVKVTGGGVSAQAGAILLGLSRAIIKDNPELKKKLKIFGYLTRDARVVERKKYGLKKARRAPQWAKR